MTIEIALVFVAVSAPITAAIMKIKHKLDSVSVREVASIRESLRHVADDIVEIKQDIRELRART